MRPYAPLALVAVLALSGCVSAPQPPTDKQQAVAAVVEDALAVGLVPVLTNNPDYLPVAEAVATALGSIELADGQLTSEAVQVFLSRYALSEEDRRTISGLVAVAWDRYKKRYASQISSNLRPDVKLFLSAAAAGIQSAVAATPRRD